MKEKILKTLGLDDNIWIQKYCDLVGRRIIEPATIGAEKHHYYPTSLFGPTNDIVFVSVSEHCMLHWYLYKAYKEHKNRNSTIFRKICFALTSFNMINDNRRKRISSLSESEMEEYSIMVGDVRSDLRLCVSEHVKEHLKKTRGTKELYDVWHAKTFTKEWREKMSAIHKGKPKSEIQKKRMSDSSKGKPNPITANVINKDPEKIRKTAEWHRGKKRPESTKKKISEKRKELCIENGGALNKGHKLYYDPLDPKSNHKQCLPCDMPEGWVEGNWFAATKPIGSASKFSVGKERTYTIVVKLYEDRAYMVTDNGEKVRNVPFNTRDNYIESLMNAGYTVNLFNQ